METSDCGHRIKEIHFALSAHVLYSFLFELKDFKKCNVTIIMPVSTFFLLFSCFRVYISVTYFLKKGFDTLLGQSVLEE